MALFIDLFRDLPDGPFWLTGKTLKEFARTLDADRARLAPTSGLEIPMPDGRWFLPNGGDGAAEVYPFKVFIRNHGTKDSPIWQRGVYQQSPVEVLEDPTDTDDLVYPDGLLDDDSPGQAS